MKLRSLFRRRNPARDLALIGVANHHRRVKATAARIREELGLPPHPALRGS